MTPQKTPQVTPQAFIFGMLFPEDSFFHCPYPKNVAHLLLRARGHLDGNYATDGTDYPSTIEGVIVPSYKDVDC
jgi:hypothetical protein